MTQFRVDTIITYIAKMPMKIEMDPCGSEYICIAREDRIFGEPYLDIE